jgi:predicted secreted Zn-dependent protease
MARKLIKLNDGTLVEINTPGEQYEAIAGSSATKVEAALSKVTPLLKKLLVRFPLYGMK